MHTARASVLAAILTAASLIGCSESRELDLVPDSGAALDGGTDSEVLERDGASAFDADVDMRVDPILDASIGDASVLDALVIDAGDDAGHDAGVRDAGGCYLGDPCTAVASCGGGTACVPESEGSIGSPSDRVYELLPDGGVSTEPTTTSWPGDFMIGGYCSNAALTSMASREGYPGACNPNGPPGEDGCGADCGRCIRVGLDAAGDMIALCHRSCTPSLTTSTCRAGYECNAAEQVCRQGCQSDAECRIARADTDHDGTLSFDDHLVYDTTSSAVCNPTTFRCDSAGTPDAVAGDRCERDFQCEANGRCFSEPALGWPGGYCSKAGCDAPGFECAGEAAVCMDIGYSACLRGCHHGGEATAENPYALGADLHGDTCDPGYTCNWDLRSEAGVTLNGGCMPGNYNSIEDSNIGASCTSDATCWSPFGHGRCIFRSGSAAGYCSVLNCQAPGMPDNICGAGAFCSQFDTTLATVCIDICETAADCIAGFACLDWDSDGPGDIRGCNPECEVDADCRVGESCSPFPGAAFGHCTG